MVSWTASRSNMKRNRWMKIQNRYIILIHTDISNSLSTYQPIKKPRIGRRGIMIWSVWCHKSINSILANLGLDTKLLPEACSTFRTTPQEQQAFLNHLALARGPSCSSRGSKRTSSESRTSGRGRTRRGSLGGSPLMIWGNLKRHKVFHEKVGNSNWYFICNWASKKTLLVFTGGLNYIMLSNVFHF